MAIAIAYGERLAQKGGNIDVDGIHELMMGYPSHSFAIDRKEAQAMFHDVRAPEGAIAEVVNCLGSWPSSIEAMAGPCIQLSPFPFLDKELLHGHQ